MPCYNAAIYIAEAIQSVLAQTFREFELLIVNDGSTDNTAFIVKSFTDDRIVFIEQPQQGIAAALNNGLKRAKADHIARFDADDSCFPDRLERQYHFMQLHPEYIVVGSAADYMDQAGNYVFTHMPEALSNAAIQALPYEACPFIHAGVMYKIEPVAAIGYNIHAHSFEDHLLWQQLKTKGKMCNLPERLLSVRLNPSSITMDERKRPAAFHRVKSRALQRGTISAEEGERLLQIISQQNNPRTKQGAYYSLLAKKFLWNNYNPPKARQHARKAIRLNDFDIKDYLLLFISYLPKNMIANLYSIFTAR
jgi:glycosyltransferase involved in cell wall biosynthesis